MAKDSSRTHMKIELLLTVLEVTLCLKRRSQMTTFVPEHVFLESAEAPKGGSVRRAGGFAYALQKDGQRSVLS